jgi:hypothetical protein
MMVPPRRGPHELATPTLGPATVATWSCTYPRGNSSGFGAPRRAAACARTPALQIKELLFPGGETRQLAGTRPSLLACGGG